MLGIAYFIFKNRVRMQKIPTDFEKFNGMELQNMPEYVRSKDIEVKE